MGCKQRLSAGVGVLLALLTPACSGDENATGATDGQDPNGESKPGGGDGDGGGTSDGGKPAPNPLEDPPEGPPAGNPEGACALPAEAQAEDTSTGAHVIGDGTPESCTSRAVVDAVAQGGVIRFDCGPEPILITLEETAKVFNDKGPKIVLDGGGLVTLSGGGARRILYMNTCDQAQVFTTPHCNNQDHPQLTVQNLTFVDGNAEGQAPEAGGGAIFASGGRLKIVNSRFFRNRGASVGQDVAGGAVRVFQQSNNLPVYIANSTFGGEAELGNACSNGGALGSIGVSFTVLNSVFTHNAATGNGANPAKPNTPGGGNGGAIANDGNEFTLDICGSRLEHNHANEHGGAIFFVSNNRTGKLLLKDSALRANQGEAFETHPGMFVQAQGEPQLTNTTLE